MSEQVGALGSSVRETFKGPTLIKVKSLKSAYDRRDPAGNFSAAFLRLSPPSAVRKTGEAVEGNLQSAGYPPVPESGDSMSDLPT